MFFSHCQRAWQLSAVRFNLLAMVFHDGRDLVSILNRIRVRSSAGGHGRLRWSATAGSRGLGAGCVGSVALARVEDTWPRIVVAGDGAFTLSGSRSSESTSRDVWQAVGGGPDESGGAGRTGWMLEEAPSRVGEPNRLMFSTIDVVRGRLEVRTAGGLRPSGFSGYTIPEAQRQKIGHTTARTA